MRVPGDVAALSFSLIHFIPYFLKENAGRHEYFTSMGSCVIKEADKGCPPFNGYANSLAVME